GLAARFAIGLQHIDADVAHGLGTLAEVDQDRITVDDVDDLADEHRWRRAARALVRARPGGPELLAGDCDLLVGQQQAALERVQHQLDIPARDLVDRAVLRARQRERPAFAVAGEIDRRKHRGTGAADAEVAMPAPRVAAQAHARGAGRGVVLRVRGPRATGDADEGEGRGGDNEQEGRSYGTARARHRRIKPEPESGDGATPRLRDSSFVHLLLTRKSARRFWDRHSSVAAVQTCRSLP